MSTKTKALLITLLFAIPTFLTGKQIWPPDPMSPSPTSSQLPFFIILALFESLSFGLGIAFLILGWKYATKLPVGSKNLSMAAFLSIVWLMINWWSHDNMHIHNGMDLQGLLFIEYGYHITLMIAGSILAYTVFKLVRFSKSSR